MTDSGNLSSQVILLFAEEEWVGVNVSLQITSEKDLDGSGGQDVLWLEIGQSSPLRSGAGGNPVL